MLLAAVFWKKYTRWIDNKPVLIGFGLLASLSTIAIGLLPAINLDAFFIIFALFTGLGTSFLCLKMGQVYGKASLGDLLTAAGISLVLAAFLYFVGIGFPVEGRLIYIGILPVLSAFFFLLKGPDESFDSPVDDERTKESTKKLLAGGTFERKLLIRLTVAAGLVAFIAGVSKGLWVNFGSSETLAQSGVEIILAIVAIAVLIIIAINTQNIRRAIYQIYTSLMLLGVFLLLASSFGFPLAYLAIFKEPLWVVLSCFMAYIAFRYDLSPILVFGIGQAAYFLSSNAGWLVGFMVSDQFLDTQLQSVAGVVLTALLLLVLIYVFNGKDLSRITSFSAQDMSNNAADEPRAGLDESTRESDSDSTQPLAISNAIRSKHGLSERECEVMLLFAQGRSASWIADTFMISTSTVRSHIRAVYVKVDVHSRQELLDFLSGDHSQ